MSYNAGIINSPTPALAIVTAIGNLIEAHAAWEFVEEVAIGSDIARVYKCLGTVNGWGDFFVVLRRSSDTGNIGFEICESWDAVNNLLIRYAPADSVTVGVGTYTGLAADGSVGSIGKAHNDAGISIGWLTPLVNGDNPWFLSVTNHRICFSMSTQGWTYAGLYESITDIARDPAPLVLLTGDSHLSGVNTPQQYYTYAMCPTDDNSNYRGGNQNMGANSDSFPWQSGKYTRQLLLGTGSQIRSNFEVLMREWTPMTFLSEATGFSSNGYSGVNHDFVEPISGKWLPSRVVLGQGSFGRSGIQTAPDLRGWLRDTLALSMYGYSPVNGDEIVVDGVTYTRMGGSRRRLRDFWIPQNV